MWVRSPALLTDLYQLTMVQAYLEHGLREPAVFELFVRHLPEERSFLLAAGLEQALDYLETLQFTDEEIDWIAKSGRFSRTLVDYLQDFRFSGDVHALPEGTVFFANEPILRVTAPLPEAQLVESRLINLLHFQTVIASKAARCRLAAPDRLLVDFGMRRAHGGEAGLLAARASYLAGFSGTATALAAPAYGIPVYGTMAHSFIEAYDDEVQAFEGFAESHPDHVILLIDTYDTERAAYRVVELAPQLRKRGIGIKGVRIDSGDLDAESRIVRAVLDEGGLDDVHIFLSGGIDEHLMDALITAGVPADGFGVGTALDTSSDAPYLNCAYKLQEYAGMARRKRSEGKATWPGRKQVFRRYGDSGRIEGDTLALEDEEASGEPLVRACMARGQRLQPAEGLEAARARALAGLDTLAEPQRRLRSGETSPVAISAGVQRLADEVDRRTEG